MHKIHLIVSNSNHWAQASFSFCDSFCCSNQLARQCWVAFSQSRRRCRIRGHPKFQTHCQTTQNTSRRQSPRVAPLPLYLCGACPSVRPWGRHSPMIRPSLAFCSDSLSDSQRRCESLQIKHDISTSNKLKTFCVREICQSRVRNRHNRGSDIW